MNTLIQLMLKKDYASISITEICKGAGYNRGTYYKHYYDKQELLDDLIELKLDELKNMLEKMKNQLEKTEVKDSEGKFQLTVTLFEYFYENRFFLYAVLKDNKVKGFRYKLYNIYKIYLASLLVGNFADPKENTEFDELKLDHICSTWLGISLFWINEESTKSPKYVAEQFMCILNENTHEIFTNEWMFKDAKYVNEETDVRIIRTKEALKRALLSLMMKKHYKDIQIIDILEEVDYNKSTFYAHFKNKHALYDSIRKDLVLGMYQAFSGEGMKYYEQMNQLSSPIHRLLQFVYQNQTLLQIMYSDMAVPGFFNKFFTEIQQVFFEELKGRTHLDESLYSNYITVTIMNLIGVWFSDNIRYSPNYMADLYLKLVSLDNQIGM